MENENNENLDSLNEGENETPEENNDNQGEDLDALKKSKQELSDKNRKLFERAKKAETEAKELREKAKAGEKPEIPEKSPSNEPDYAKLAFLKAEGVDNSDDQKLVQEEANRLKLPLTDILQMEHIKSKLKDSKDQREAEAGMPKGRGQGSGKTQADVDFWLAKGEAPKDLELAEKYFEAREKRDRNNQMFDENI